MADTGIHMTLFIVSCVSGGWSGIGGFVPAGEDNAHRQHGQFDDLPNPGSSGFIHTSVGWATCKWGRERCLFSVSAEASVAIAFHRFKSTCPWFQRG